jgi:hypothetical protein
VTLTEWARLVNTELELDHELGKDEIDRILEVARDAAHSVARPAAPVTTFLLGIAVGRGADPAAAAAAVQRLALAQSPEASSQDNATS